MLNGTNLKGKLYEFSRMAFGLRNAPGYFQRSMQIVLAGISIDEALIYIDDFLLHSPDVPTHLATLRKVFKRLSLYGLKIKPAKCQIMKTEVDYLGHTITEEGTVPIENRTKSIVQYPKPTTCRALKRFIGMLNWYRNYIPNCSSLLRPLTKAQAKTKLNWTAECQHAFDEAKKLLLRECGDKDAIAARAVEIASTVNKHTHNKLQRVCPNA